MFECIMIFSAVIIVVSFFRSKYLFKGVILSVMQGISALFAVNFIGGFTGLHLSINYFSLAVSAFGGLPGVIFLVVSDFLPLL